MPPKKAERKEAKDADVLTELKDSESHLLKTIDIYTKLSDKYNTNSNFRYIDQIPNRRGIADAHLMLAQCHRHQALLLGKVTDEQLIQRSKCVEHLTAARRIYSEMIGARAKKGLGGCQRLLGQVKADQGEWDQALIEWQGCLPLFQDAGEDAEAAAVAADIDTARIEINRAQVLRERFAAMAANNSKEEAAVRAAFAKFDRDNSGTIELNELQTLAVELGTFPKLSDDEIEELQRQLQCQTPGVISFDELWTWWLNDIVLGKSL